MFLSVIIAVYNAEDYIKECVRSVQKQSLENFEIILVNDGSEDSSFAVCQDFAEEYKNISAFSISHSGAAAARNAGLKQAKGDYVLFLDSDDFILREDCFEQLLINSKSGCEAIFFKYRDYFDNTKVLEDCPFSYKNARNAETYAKKIEALVRDDAFYGMAWTKCIKRNFLSEQKIDFQEGLKGEDMDWNFKLVTTLSDICFIDEPFIAYRRRAGSASTQNSLKQLADFVYIIKKWQNRVSEIEDETLKTALFGALAKYYANLLITYTRVSDTKKKIFIPEIKALSPLLKYAAGNRAKLVARAYAAGGLGFTLKLLKLKDKRN